MKKRLCDLVDLVENSKDCVVLALKDSTTPMDLIRLGGFNGDETMFRMTKSKGTTSITIFRDGEKPFSMSMGHSTTVLAENMRVARSLICECVHLDFGICTHEAYQNRYKEAVEATVGMRDLDSHRYFELQRAPEHCSLWVNQTHIACIRHEDLDAYFADRNIKLNIEYTRNSGRVPVDVGTMERADRTIERSEIGQLLMVIENYKGLCEHNFLVTEEWLHEKDFAKESRAYMRQGIDSLKNWGGFYLGSNITFDVKKCESLEELHRFMNGDFNDMTQAENSDWYWEFRREDCSPQALEMLDRLLPESQRSLAPEPISSLMQEAKEKAAERNEGIPDPSAPRKGSRGSDLER